MYEAITYGLEHIDSELSCGWLDSGSIELLKLIKGNAISADASWDELYDAYLSLDDKIKDSNYSIRDFFCTNQYGDVVNDGVYNFLETIDHLENAYFNGKDVVVIDDEGGGLSFNFSLAGGDAAIADALGISEELVTIILHAAVDIGFNVNFE